MKVSQVSLAVSRVAYKKQELRVADFKPKVEEKNKPWISDKSKALLSYSCAGVAVLGLALFAIPTTRNKILKSKPTSSKTEGCTTDNPIIDSVKEKIPDFAADNLYRKKILETLGLDSSKVERIRSIIGGEEYKYIIKEFENSPIHYTPGETLITLKKDGFNQAGKEARTYRASFHSHTNNSDGAYSVEEFLNESALYADNVAETLKNKPGALAKNAPFTIAITDHDTIEGCKEAVKIIEKNPEKFKNLRVVLGCELSVENRMINKDLKEPVQIHMLLHGINPFDKKLNQFLNSKKQAKLKLCDEIIKECAEKLKDISPETAKSLNIEEAKTLYKTLEDGLLYPNHGLRDYLRYKTIFSETFEQNSEIKNMLKEKGVDISKIDFKSLRYKYFSKNYAGSKACWEEYHKGLIQFTVDKLGIDVKEIESKMALKPDILNFVKDEIPKFSQKAMPKLEKDAAFADMEETINIIKGLDEGNMVIAHPGLIDIGHYLKNKNESLDAIKDVFKTFKEKGGDRAFGAEIYYHYYGDLGKSSDWLKLMQDSAKENGLHFTGGLDSHERSIFYSCKTK